MNNKAGTIVGLAIGFLGSIFMGVVGISIGLGAAYPPINFVAKPFVCLQGQMTFDKTVSHPMPGESYATIDWYCTDPRSRERSELDYFSIIPYSGVFYGLLCFPLFLTARYFFKRWDDSLKTKYGLHSGSRGRPPKKRK